MLFPAKKSRANDDKESEAQNSMSASADSNDRQALYDSVLNSKDDGLELGTTRSAVEGEDEFLLELVKKYESDDTVGDNLKSEQLAKLVNKMFCCKLSEKNLKDRLDRQERPTNCDEAKPPKTERVQQEKGSIILQNSASFNQRHIASCSNCSWWQNQPMQKNVRK